MESDKSSKMGKEDATRLSLYISPKDEILNNFMNSQSNVSASIRMLVKAFVANYKQPDFDIQFMDLKDLLDNAVFDPSIIKKKKDAETVDMQESENSEVSQDIDLGDVVTDAEDPFDEKESAESNNTEETVEIESSKPEKTVEIVSVEQVQKKEPVGRETNDDIAKTDEGVNALKEGLSDDDSDLSAFMGGQ